jgi:hypothetical protein
VVDICVLGVYLGRDIAYLRDAFREEGREDVRIVGVDLFADVPGADWPDEKRHLSWAQAGFGSAPSLEVARRNLAELGLDGGVTLNQANAIEFLEQHPRAFDLVYIDIAHDYASTRDAIRASLKGLRPAGILCGDDYSDQGTWGVKRAVDEACAAVHVFSSWIWLARAEEVRPRPAADSAETPPRPAPF